MAEQNAIGGLFAVGPTTPYTEAEACYLTDYNDYLTDAEGNRFVVYEESERKYG